LEHLYSTQNDFAVSTSKKSLIQRIRLEENQCASNTEYLFGSFKIPLEKKIDVSGLIVALDSIRDPGNLGTILRLCDWFGVTEIVCSKETVDLYNPKVVQATMGPSLG
jgi:TrmH family RNA methyltransferase